MARRSDFQGGPRAASVRQSHHARSRKGLLGPMESPLSTRPTVLICDSGSGTLPQEPSTHWATTVLLPVLPAPSLPCHNILPDFLLCHCSCQIGWLCRAEVPLCREGPMAWGGTDSLPVSKVSRKPALRLHFRSPIPSQGTVSTGFPTPPRKFLGFLSHLLTLCVGRSAFILMQIVKKPVAAGRG